jgi:hypothetical protein
VEATVQTLTTSLPNEEPFIGDGAEGELVTNTADGRIWVADVAGNPIELGGACVNRPINGNLFAGNYLDLDVTNPDNLPVPVPDPNNIPAGFYREIRILMRFVGTPLETFATYFDYDVDWGDKTFWTRNSGTWGGLPVQSDSPLDFFTSTGSIALIELSSFGPQPAWMGRVVWGRTGS